MYVMYTLCFPLTDVFLMLSVPSFFLFFSEIIIRVSSVLPDKVYEEHIYNFMAYKATEMNIIIDSYT